MESRGRAPKRWSDQMKEVSNCTLGSYQKAGDRFVMDKYCLYIEIEIHFNNILIIKIYDNAESF